MTNLLELLKQAQGLGWEFEFADRSRDKWWQLDNGTIRKIPTIPEVEKAIVEMAKKSFRDSRSYYKQRM